MNKGDKIDIFIVEDNNVFSMALKADIETAFASKKLTIHSFETGEDCMKEFSGIKPEVVILDYNLSSKTANAADGIKVLDWIKKDNPETNVIMLTGEDSIDIAKLSYQHGASDYVVKTETKFRKINYSLFNLFKIIDAKAELKKYKKMTIGVVSCVALVFFGVILIQIYYPEMLL